MDAYNNVAVAVSGGVDSLTLATFAHRRLASPVHMFHAVSSAVPAEATQRVEQLAQAEGWHLTMIDAGEFSDPQYRANPVNRCFYCKSHLYDAVARRTSWQIVSGTNLDDLADIAQLPASPCLSSRIETAIVIEPDVLELVHEIETFVSHAIAVSTVRCRVRPQGMVIELDAPGLQQLSRAVEAEIRAQAMVLMERGGRHYELSFAVYRNGSAFVHQPGRAGVALP